MSLHFVSRSAAITHLADVKSYVSVLEYQRSDAGRNRGLKPLEYGIYRLNSTTTTAKSPRDQPNPSVESLAARVVHEHLVLQWLRQDRAKIAAQEANYSRGW
jgi:hypothetical protein